MMHSIHKKRIGIVFVGILLLSFFYFFSREVKRGFLKQADFTTTVKIQERIDKSSRLRLTSVIGNVMEGSTFFASPAFTSVVVVLLTLAALFDIRKKSTQGGPALGGKIRLRALVIPVLFGLLVLGEIYGKNVVHHPAPLFFMIKNPITIFPTYYINEQFSYPSGHTARAVFMGFVLLSFITYHVPLVKKNFRKWVIIGGTVFFYVVVVALGRIYLGHHWLSDVIGGGLLGGGFGLLTMGIISPIIDGQ